MTKLSERYVAFCFGFVFVVVLLYLAIQVPDPTPFQYTVFRIILALAAGGVAAMIPGFLTITVSRWIRAGGALAVFIVVYFYSPAEMTGVKVKTEQEVEIDKPIVHDFHSPPNTPSLVVSNANDLLKQGAVQQRYQTIKVDGVKAKVPSNTTVVANEIDGLHDGALIGSDFSIVARRVANITIDSSADREAGVSAGAIRLYVKIIENSRVFAKGAPGTPGKQGDAGANGADGENGRDGNCGGFGAYRGADPGRPGGDAGNGQDGQPGEDGKPGGLVAITTIVNPISSSIDITGGQGGAGGQGGNAGTPGRGGSGGRGCTGLGGTQPNQADGRPGRQAQPGQAANQGRSGAAGEYRLQIVKSFNPIIQKLKAHSNEQLHNALLSP